MEQIFRTISHAVSLADAAPEAARAMAFAAWHRCSGEAIRSRTEPLDYADGHLIVAVRDVTWQRHLEQLAPQMVAQLNSDLGQGAVRFVEFHIVDRLNWKDIDTNSAPPKDVKSVSPSLAAAATAIADVDLRASFLAAAGRCLHR